MNKEIAVEKTCVFCKEVTAIKMTEDQAYRIASGEELIQNIVPNMSPDHREMFISGICGKCFDNMFKMW